MLMQCLVLCWALQCVIVHSCVRLSRREIRVKLRWLICVLCAKQKPDDSGFLILFLYRLSLCTLEFAVDIGKNNYSLPSSSCSMIAVYHSLMILAINVSHLVIKLTRYNHFLYYWIAEHHNVLNPIQTALKLLWN